ncbi:hypothetical protein AC249_AIPGENE16185 [Exaiptasia diaphana]|nr:hypothetical protein AC249_AIPGENE16185 [Exaiptasia diaphana]
MIPTSRHISRSDIVAQNPYPRKKNSYKDSYLEEQTPSAPPAINDSELLLSKASSRNERDKIKYVEL